LTVAGIADDDLGAVRNPADRGKRIARPVEKIRHLLLLPCGGGDGRIIHAGCDQPRLEREALGRKPAEFPEPVAFLDLKQDSPAEGIDRNRAGQYPHRLAQASVYDLARGIGYGPTTNRAHPRTLNGCQQQGD